MLFNSYEFIFFFLPIVLSVYFFLGRMNTRNLANVWVLLASLFFYGWWDFKYLFLLMGSIVANYLIAQRILEARGKEQEGCAKAMFLLGLAVNLGMLGWYKYTDFFISTFNYIIGTEWSLLHIILPLGISFFTITQTLYLLDCYVGAVNKGHDFLNYALFVSFFPHLMAGPILFHKPMMMQFHDRKLRQVNWDNLVRGFSLFIIGLAKKVLIADSFIGYVGNGFGNADIVTFWVAWTSSIAYMLQLFFDFSGYSDMAVGLSRMMNIKIPINFNAPFRAGSLINFWQRWHMSLTNAITACVYIPMLRSFKKSSFRHAVAASFVTFFFIGIWHGAGWNYVIYALIHATGIVINHAWKHYHLWMPKFLGHILTLLCLVISLVFFRAANVNDALQMLQAMVGLHGMEPYWQYHLLMGNLFDAVPGKTLLLGILIIMYSPTSNEIVEHIKPSLLVAIALAVCFGYTLLQLNNMTEFLYFQF